MRSLLLPGCSLALLLVACASFRGTGAMAPPPPPASASLPTAAPSPTPTPTTTLAAEATTNTAQRPAGPIPPPRRDVPGRRYELAPKRQLFVPDFFRPDLSPTTPIVVHFLGASWCVEQCFYDAHRNAVLLTVNKASDTDFDTMGIELTGLLGLVRARLATEGIANNPMGPICITSFSGGYQAVRGILRRPELVTKISDVVLADSLYGPKVKGTEDQLEPGALQPFLDYARRASKEQGTFWFSHLYPPEERYRGNTTTLAASYLIDQLGAKRVPASGTNSRGAKLLYRADLGNFHVLGYAGMTTQDHFEHLYSIADLLKQTSLTPVP